MVKKGESLKCKWTYGERNDIKKKTVSAGDVSGRMHKRNKEELLCGRKKN